MRRAAIYCTDRSGHLKIDAWMSDEVFVRSDCLLTRDGLRIKGIQDMGCMATEAGITIQSYNADGIKEGDSVHGAFARVYGIARDRRLAASDMSLDPIDMGSSEWLTVVAIADTDDKLQAMLDETSVLESSFNLSPCESSASSRHVQLDLHIGDQRETLKDRVTISTGNVVQPSAEDPVTRLQVLNIKVLPSEIKLSDHPELLVEWQKMTLLSGRVTLGKLPGF